MTFPSLLSPVRVNWTSWGKTSRSSGRGSKRKWLVSSHFLDTYLIKYTLLSSIAMIYIFFIVHYRATKSLLTAAFHSKVLSTSQVTVWYPTVSIASFEFVKPVTKARVYLPCFFFIVYCVTLHGRLINQGVSDYIHDNCCTLAFFTIMSVCGWCIWFWQQEADATLRKARALKAQRREEYQKAQSSTNRSQEEQSNAGNKQLEKKRRLEEEALQKVGRRENDSGENSWCDISW